MLRAPAIFAATWNLLKGRLDPVTAAKTQFVPRTDPVSETAALEAVGIDRAILPPRFGGTRPEGQPPCPNVKGEPDVVAPPLTSA